MSLGMTRIDPPLPVMARTSPDVWFKAQAHAWISYGPGHELIWLVAFDGSREFWSVNNKDVRARDNITAGGTHNTPEEREAAYRDMIRRLEDEEVAAAKKAREAGPADLKEMLAKAVAAHGLEADVIAAQIKAAEVSDQWEPQRTGPRGAFIENYRCRACNIVKRWPVEHNCPEWATRAYAEKEKALKAFEEFRSLLREERKSGGNPTDCHVSYAGLVKLGQAVGVPGDETILLFGVRVWADHNLPDGAIRFTEARK